MELRRPVISEYASEFSHYLGNAPEGDGLVLLAAQSDRVAALFRGLTENQGIHRYAPDKWSLKDLLQHLSDSERYFAFSCLRIARGDATPIPGLDGNAFAAMASADDRSFADLVTDFCAARASNISFYRSLSSEAWARAGTSYGRALTARCIPYIGLAHVAHHLEIVQTRYLPSIK